MATTTDTVRSLKAPSGQVSAPCSQCPWRTCNHGQRHRHGFYTKANLSRLWNQIRKGSGVQSCHPTDPSHPDHGAKEDSTARECPGSVILVLRELSRLGRSAEGPIEGAHVKNYLAARRKGLTRLGIAYWLISRYQHGGVPFVGGPKLPNVDVDDPEISLPGYLAE